MRLLRLIAEFNLVQARLAQSTVGASTTPTRVALMRRPVDLIDGIERADG